MPSQPVTLPYVPWPSLMIRGWHFVGVVNSIVIYLASPCKLSKKYCMPNIDVLYTVQYVVVYSIHPEEFS